MIKHDLAARIEKDFNEYLALFPFKSDEIKNIAMTISEGLRVFFMKTITQMSATDIISVDFLDILQHVIQVYKVINAIDYCQNIPIDIIFDYILPYRVNDENFSLYNACFYKELAGLIDEGSIQNSALSVNYWCYSKATYAQADDRTQNAMTTVKSGKGRCGEESVLLVSALRSVGIPARQCYSPHWSHCDDNHAWVEIYTGNCWEFMGACEPEEKLNIGWFNNAASRALMVRHRCFGLSERQINSDQNNIFDTHISTNVYGKTRNIAVSVTNENEFVSHARVGLYVINYCMPKLVLEKTADKDGKAIFEVGMGDFLLFTHIDGNYDIKICSQNDKSINLNISKNIKHLEFNLIPYDGDISNIDFEPSNSHKEKMIRLLDERIKAHSRVNEGNEAEIDKFLNYSSVTIEDKNKILNTLTKKDFTDVTFDVLCDMILSLEYEDKLQEEIFNKYVLPLRVENEHLYKHRNYVKEFFAAKNIVTPQAIFDYVNSNIKLLDDYTYTGLVADIKGVLQNNIATAFSLPIHLVQIFRSLGIPARLNHKDRDVEYFNGSDFISVYSKKSKTSKFKFVKNTQKNFSYGEDFTVCKIDNERLNFLNISDELKKSDEAVVSEGLYVITKATRQIDGSVTGDLCFSTPDKNEDVQIILNEHTNKTKEKLKDKKIDKSIINEDGKIILGYIESRSEPTEHFLNELLENEAQIKNLGIKVILEGETPEINNETYVQSEFTKEWKQFRKDMGIGDLRLPFITAVSDKKGLFSFANYNVGTVDLLLKIFKEVD